MKRALPKFTTQIKSIAALMPYQHLNAFIANDQYTTAVLQTAPRIQMLFTSQAEALPR
jgi:hypothetical protein